MKKISIFGVTGSVGKNTCDVVLNSSEKFDVQAVSANTNVDELAHLAIELRAKYAVIRDEKLYDDLKRRLDNYPQITPCAGHEALLEVAQMPVDLVMASIVGMAGLEPVIKAIGNAKHIAIANKEPLVSAGEFITAKAKEHNTTLLPVDSEHNAIFQVFDFEAKEAVKRIILTASGGPFLNTDKSELENITPEQAVKHPNWSMGRKISVDSATMMNKALEIIEAHYLFDMPSEKIDVLIHPQSIIHSLVEYNDGSILAQMGATDMRTPIAYCLAWPKRMKTQDNFLDLGKLTRLDFSIPDHDKFNSLNLAYEALKAKGCVALALNAANEIAVEAFLERKIKFTDIVKIVSKVMEQADSNAPSTAEEILERDRYYRSLAQSLV